MGGAGRKTIYGNALTARTTVRSVSTADSSINAVVETIDTRIDTNGSDVTSGHDATLVIGVVLNGATSVDISLWYNCSDEVGGGASVWCRYATATGITVDSLFVYNAVPAGEWKVMVNATNGGVIIREAHSA